MEIAPVYVGNRMKLVQLVFLCTFPLSLLGLTFNIDLEKHAEIDIIVSRIAPPDAPFNSPMNTNPSDIIARYSFYITWQNEIRLWQQKYRQFMTEVFFISPADRFWLPSIHPNPMAIILEETEILNALGADITEIYVIITQRTYYYSARFNRIFLYANVVLMQGFVPINDVITIEASGLINPAVFNEVPANLQSTYPIATGSAI
jgi:hypothetical protein